MSPIGEQSPRSASRRGGIGEQAANPMAKKKAAKKKSAKKPAKKAAKKTAKKKKR
ncbi:MAG TPA: hypothetical protein VMT56_00055 [Candidatus Bathyarchaeia archaeon]|nr:hypothetical protein [Candidatus Bathyarchaeia archaeon]